MTTDPGDLVLDPTCGSGTTAYVAEQWGRRWITCDTSRVALALTRTRLMVARYPYYYLADLAENSLWKGSGSHRQNPSGRSQDPGRHPQRLCLQNRLACHPQGHRQQQRDRQRSLPLAGEAGVHPGGVEHAASSSNGKSGRFRERRARSGRPKPGKNTLTQWWDCRRQRQRREIDNSIAPPRPILKPSTINPTKIKSGFEWRGRSLWKASPRIGCCPPMRNDPRSETIAKTEATRRPVRDHDPGQPA